MKRVITSFTNAKKDLLNLIINEFPNGVDEQTLINFPTAGGGSIRALEIVIEDNVYLVKMDNENFYQKYLAKDNKDNEIDDNDLEVD